MILTAYLLLASLTPANAGLTGFGVTSSFSTATCTAATAAQFSSCITQMRSGLASSTHITAMIPCNTTGECNFDLSGFPTSTSAPKISVYGDGNGTTGFSRSVDNTNSLLTIFDSSWLSITGLTFDDTALTTTTSNATVGITQATDIVLSNNTFLGVKDIAIAFNIVSRVQITNNTFDASEVFGLWSQNASEFHLSNNVFSNTWANGLFMGLNNSKIVTNNFDHNHYKAIFGVSGGQLDIVSSTNNLYIGCNDVHDSSIPGTPGAVGIETDNKNVNNVQMIGNTIENHDGYAVSINYDVTNVSNITIDHNLIFNNGISPVTGTQIDYNPNPPGGFTPTIFSNCTNTSCLVTCNTVIDSIFANGFNPPGF